MEHLFSSLSRAVEGAPAAALGAAAVWGILSIILSPCHMASLPLIVAFISGQGRVSVARAGAIATLFATGILITIAIIGVVTAAAGRMLGDIGRWSNYLVAGIFFLVGLHLVGVLPMPWSGPGQVNMKRKGLLGALVLGLVFGIALGPCTFAFMASAAKSAGRGRQGIGGFKNWHISNPPIRHSARNHKSSFINHHS
jgi:cytochrome c-type biogenesis protein